MIKLILIVHSIMNFSFGINPCYTNLSQPSVSNFSIVIDCSGSMRGKAIKDTKFAVNSFIEELKIDDNANLITFNSTVALKEDLTKNKNSLFSVIDKITVGGATALYDAIAKSAQTLRKANGSKIIIFLTDGEDTGSKFSLRELESMNISEGIFIYGIGLGNVNKTKLDKLSKITSGSFYSISSSSELSSIYNRVINAYYDEYGKNISTTSSLVIKSLPSGMNVIIDGITRGKTPLKLDGLFPKESLVQIGFNKGIWDCDVALKEGCRSIIDARDSDLGQNLYISSEPLGVSIFLDGNYMGETPYEVKTEKKRFSRNKKIYAKTCIPLIPKGLHTLKVIGAPEADIGLDYTLEFEIKNKDRFIHINVFNKNHLFSDGESGSSSNNPFNDKSLKDPFEQLDEL